MQSPSPTPSDMKMVTFSPTLHSPPPQVCEFLFLVYCIAARQSLHVFPWKPFCLLSIFLHYLLFALCFSICLFSSHPFLFHFLPPLSLHLPLYPSPILSLNFCLTTVCDKSEVWTAPLGQRHHLWGWWDKRCSSLCPIWRFIGLG